MQSVAVSPEEQEVHANALRILNQSRIPYVVAGAAAIGHYTGLWRHTKDLDLFLVPDQITAALTALAAHGYTVEVPAPHWLAHAYCGSSYVDLIYGFGGWRAAIDELWFDRSQPATLLGQPVHVAPVEDLIWIKAFVGHRERFDGADILHLINACAQSIDWGHLLRRFDRCWQLLLFYLNLYCFVYPADRSDIPSWVVEELINRWRAQRRQPVEDPCECRGTLIDRFSFLADIREGFHDGRERWAIAQGWSPRDLQRDRVEAEQMLAAGLVRPDRVA